jgi:tetratricopeptide (TPR) repeat protein
MSKKSIKEQSQSDAGFEGIEHALTKSEQFIEDNQKLLLYSIIGIVAIVVIFIGSKRYYIEPKEKDAANEMFMAEKFFERDSFALALNGYGTYPGFLQIIDEYSITKSANLAKYYAGVCYLNLGEYQNAIDKLKGFKTNDLLIGSAKYSSLGDAYSESGDYIAAANYYTEGAEKFRNNYSTPVLLKKAGLVYEELGKFDKSFDLYTRIKKEYPKTPEGLEIDKFIERVKDKAGK